MEEVAVLPAAHVVDGSVLGSPEDRQDDPLTTLDEHRRAVEVDTDVGGTPLPVSPRDRQPHRLEAEIAVAGHETVRAGEPLRVVVVHADDERSGRGDRCRAGIRGGCERKRRKDAYAQRRTSAARHRRAHSPRCRRRVNRPNGQSFRRAGASSPLQGAVESRQGSRGLFGAERRHRSRSRGDTRRARRRGRPVRVRRSHRARGRRLRGA